MKGPGWLLVLLAVLLAGTALAGPVPVLTDVTKEAGIGFVHIHGGSGQKHMIETMGSGVAFLDMDGDGDLDLLFTQSGPVPGTTFFGKTRTSFPNALYENVGSGRFKDVTKGSGIEGKGYSMGVAAGDIDGDGLPDVYIPCYGHDELYKNMGGGKFRDITKEAGIDNASWGTSAAFADLDSDGDLDVYVCNYVKWDPAHNIFCGRKEIDLRIYCTPEKYDALRHRLYRNKGNGTFEDVTRTAGVARADGKGLGVVAGDYDGDGLLDLYVADDLTPNFLFHNVSKSPGPGKPRELRFEDVTLLSGTAFSPTGRAEAGMGVDMGDVDGDGRLDIFVTNFGGETNELYWNAGDGTFAITTDAMGLGDPSWPFVGFGTGLVDLDLDGDLDIFVANGHVIDNAELFDPKKGRSKQPKLLHINTGHGTFEESAAKSGPALVRPEASRAAAFGDYDNDGDLDIAVGNNNAAAVLLRNDGPTGKGITLVLKGKGMNRQGLGARVTATVSGKTIVREAKTGYSYFAANDPRVEIGLGSAAVATRISVRWLSGKVSELANVGPGFVTVEEP